MIEIRAGMVISTHPENCTVRVQFSDMDDFISGELQILQNKTLQDKYYFMYDIGESVLCVLMNNGGYVLGSVYNKVDRTVIAGQDVSGVVFSDGTEVKYDRESHVLTLDVKGNVEVSCNNAEISCDCCHVKSGDIKLGEGALQGVIHAMSPCPVYGVYHLRPSLVTRTEV